MKIKILGTAAAEGFPALFCRCGACEKARRLGGKNIRTRSSLQIDDLLKVDLPPETIVHMEKHNLELHRLRYILFSHSHGDHLCGSELEYLISPYAVPPVTDSVKLIGNETSREIIYRATGFTDEKYPGLFTTVGAFQTIELPPYRVTTVKARHSPAEEALNFIIEKEGKKVLYTCDTGFYEEATWDFLKTEKVDMVVSECTEGPNNSDYPYHMGFPNVRKFRKRAEEIGLTDADTPWVLTHFTHGGGLLHDELKALVNPEGFIVAWDGLEIEI